MAARKNRDHLVIATKFTTPYRSYELGKDSHSVNYFGNHRRSMHVSVRDSLKKLQTDYIDVLWVPSRCISRPKSNEKLQISALVGLQL